MILLSSGVIRLLPLLFLTSTLVAQAPSDLDRERADYLAWLRTAPVSPLAALAHQQVGDSVRLGPAGADIPLTGIAQHKIFPSQGALLLQTPSGTHPVSRGRPFRLGGYTVFLSRSSGGPVLTLFGSRPAKAPPGYYPVDRSVVFTGLLRPPRSPAAVRVLTADGVETEAVEAGSVLVPLGGGTRLTVRRIQSPDGEESELEIFFRDASNGQGTYPAGRFVSLIPVAERQYRLDFNRARNPFCAYSSVYPCPAPWQGNVIAEPVRAGERY